MHGLALLLALVVLLVSCSSKDRLFVPVVASAGNEVARLETRIHYPKGNGPFPVVVLLHGSSGGNPKDSDSWSTETEFLTARGFAAIAFMRRGRGGSTGVTAESEERNCKDGAWEQGLDEAFADVDAVIKHIATIGKIDARHIVLWGVSRGGFLSVRYSAAGKHKARIRQVVNFVGGWVAQAEDQCERDFNLDEFRKLGSLTRTPMLWLYGDNDKFYGPKAPSEYFKEFSAAGGNAEFHLVAGIPANGHWLSRYPEHWKNTVASFLSPRQEEK